VTQLPRADSPFMTLRPPSSLFSDGRFFLPTSLADSYSGELASRGLLATARGGTSEKSIWGGPSVAETEKHFTHRFANSSIRLVCVRSLEP